MDEQLELAVRILVVHHGQVRLHSEEGFRYFARQGSGLRSLEAQQPSVKQIGMLDGNGAESRVNVSCH